MEEHIHTLQTAIKELGKQLKQEIYRTHELEGRIEKLEHTVNKELYPAYCEGS